jgi:hypothetical protein
MNGSFTIEEVERQKAELARIRALLASRTCSNCDYSDPHDAFSDVLIVCRLDKNERSARAVCELWAPKNGDINNDDHASKNGNC